MRELEHPLRLRTISVLRTRLHPLLRRGMFHGLSEEEEILGSAQPPKRRPRGLTGTFEEPEPSCAVEVGNGRQPLIV